MNKSKKQKVLAFIIISFLCIVLTYSITDANYDSIENTQSIEVINITENIGSLYVICPELLQAIIYYESSNNPRAYNNGCIGYMQISEKWHRDRMQKLGVSDLTDGYGNILVGVDYLMELAEEYGDVSLVLMKYNGDSRANELYEQGRMSDYAEKILMLSAELERKNGK